MKLKNLTYMKCLQVIFSLKRQTTIMFIIFRDFLKVEQIFLSPQVKRSVINSKKLVYTSCETTENLGP